MSGTDFLRIPIYVVWPQYFKAYWSGASEQQNLLVANDHLRKLEPEYHGLNVYPNYFYNCHGFFYFEAFHKWIRELKLYFHRLLASASVKLTYAVKGNQNETNQVERVFIENEMSRTSSTHH